MEEILFILNRNNKPVKYMKNNDSPVETAKNLLKVKDKLKMIELIEFNIEKIKDYYEERISSYKCDIIENNSNLTKEELIILLNNEYLIELIDELKEKIMILKKNSIREVERNLEYKYNKLLAYIDNIDEDNLGYLLKKKVIFEDYYYSLEKYYFLLKNEMHIKKENVTLY